MKDIILLFLASLMLTACSPAKNIVDNNLNILDNTNLEESPVEDIEDELDVVKKELVEPVADFSTRISKKPFGIYISPDNSPVQPEKFTGYHTGVDVEYGDLAEDTIPVLAIADGEVLRSAWVSGYGGMLAIRHQIEGKSYIVIYGHLSPNSLAKLGQKVSAGDIIGNLGQAYSQETAGERKHLHLAIYTGSDINVKGYVARQSDLSLWLDPVEFFK
ncbi:MAG: M23 family metallopeptidase [Patescibacteria group bacterium]